jgi:hypothetical protein
MVGLRTRLAAEGGLPAALARDRFDDVGHVRSVATAAIALRLSAI